MNRKAAAAIFAITLSGSLVAVVPVQAVGPGDASRFETWVGYDVGRSPGAVEAADFSGDGLPDAAWARTDFFENSLSVTLNLGDGTLGPAQSYPTTSQSTDVVAADLDSDGDIDLAVSARGDDYANSVIDIFRNDGSGHFTRETAVGGRGPESMTAGDVDRDGDPDLVLANYNEYPDSTVSVVRNRGDGTFAPEETTMVGFRVHDVVIGDFTEDAVVDIAAVRLNEETNRDELHILQQRPDGSFRPDAEPQPFDVATNGGVGSPTLDDGDLDGDGDLDLVVAGGSTSEDAVLRNDGTGVFSVDAYAARVIDIRLADVDGDGDLDISGVGGGGGIQGTATVQRNDGTGAFAPAEPSVTGNNPVALEVADLQRDGRPDLLVAAADIGTGVTHLQRLNGAFSSPPGGQLFAPSVDVATADIDGDGDVDVAAAVQGDFTTGDSIRLMANNGQGGLSTGGTLAAGGSEPRSLAFGDLDGDGDADLSWLTGDVDTVVNTAINSGTGTFQPGTTHGVATCSDHLNLGDVDGDGDLDQVVANESFGRCSAAADEVSVNVNNGAGVFPVERLVRLTTFTSDVAIADVDGDGVADLVGGGQGGQDDIAVALGTDAGGFAAPVFTTTGAQHREIVATDLDADGDLDVASNTVNSGTVVLLGAGSASFADVRYVDGEVVAGYRNAVGIAAGDVNDDQIIDLVVANETGSDVGVHTGYGDGAFEQRQVKYGMRPRVTDVALADLDGDGVLDIVSPAQLPSDGAALRQTQAASSGERTQPLATAAERRPGLTLLLGSRPQCTVLGGPYGDVLRGTQRTDVICGGGGDDLLLGLGGSDILRGGGGADELRGRAGLDVLDGGPQGDVVSGGPDADSLSGGPGPDRFTGGGGRDVLDLIDRTRRNDTGVGGAGRDHCRSDSGDSLSSCP